MPDLFSRVIALLLWVSVASGIGAGLSGAEKTWPVWLGACIGALLWLAWDSWQALRFLGWLKQLQENTIEPPRNGGIWREITDRIRYLLRQQNKRRQESNEKLNNFESLLEASPNGVIVLDGLKRIEWCNQTACAHFGFDVRRDQGQSVTHLLRDPAFSTYLADNDFSDAVALDSPVATLTHPLRLSVRLHPYGYGHTLMLSQDITALEQADAMRRDFVANVSHEIRTPLAVLAGFIETMQNLPLSDDECGQYLGRMAQQAGRMQELVNSLLTLSRLENSPPLGFQEWISVNQLLQRCEADAIALSELITHGRPHQLIFFAGTERQTISEIAGKSDELHSAMFNLISNAIRYTPAGDKIEVSWKQLPGGSGVFSVKDSGPGIAPEHLPRLTERFYRIDRSRSIDNGGVGLGLSIVKHVLHRHDATLHIESTPGQGACFTAIFPSKRLRTNHLPVSYGNSAKSEND